jgi:thiol-disulfide isomerase/thioredoxin
MRAPGRSLILLFTNPGCEPCQRILAQVPAWQERAGRQADLVVVSRGSAADNEEKAQQHKLSRVLLQDGREVNKAFGVSSTPSAVLVRPDGRIGSPVAGGATAVAALVEGILPGTNGTGPTGSTLTVGDDLPSLPLATLAGTTFAGVPAGREAILLFWSPTCGSCRNLASDVLAWEANRSADSPELLILSIGDIEAIRAEGFQSTVLIDDGTNVRARFGSRGTPSAVRINASGKIASPVAHGSTQVLAMLG